MLVFIDTNIFLDYYRVKGGDAAHRQLQMIERVKEHIITTYQVEMEYKKNRQAVILQTLQNMQKIDSALTNSAPLLLEAQPTKMIKKLTKRITSQQAMLKEKVGKILSNPAYNDDVYKSAQRLFKTNSELNLNRNKDARYTIRRLAHKRFMLGYPPRKSGDTSVGDAVNWEWIIYCAKKRNDDVIIVSRDKDFGISHNGESYINDWLKQEFKQRVNQRKDVTLTQKLTDALEKLHVSVTEEDKNEEQALIENYSDMADS
jgi:hypothetical protein